MRYLDAVRYPDGSGLTAEGRARREAVRLQVAQLFAQDIPVREIAKRLRVSHNAVYVWRRRWLADGEAGLLSKGASGNRCRLSPKQLEQLAAEIGRASCRERVDLCVLRVVRIETTDAE